MGQETQKCPRDQQRLQTSLQTNCLICYLYPLANTFSWAPLLQDSCLLKCFQHARFSAIKCPHCTQEMYRPVNQGELEPSCIPERVFLFQLEFETVETPAMRNQCQAKQGLPITYMCF